MRQWIVVAGLLLVSGCGGGGSAGTAATGPSAGRSAAIPSGTPSVVLNGVRPGQEKATKIDGRWRATTGGIKVALYLYRGAAAINTPRFCSGTIDATGLVKLACADKNPDRTAGRATLKGNTLTVTWQGGPTDTFTRAK